MAFVITGWLDQILRGSFHFTLVNYINYNFRFASEHYGKMPVYTFGALFAALTIPPTFFMRYNGLKWRELYSPLFPVIVYFTVFLIAHTLVPHKEERFMVPVLPLFLVLLTPLIVYLIQNRHPWRLVYFSLVNGVVLYFASFSVAQNNIVGLALFLDRHTEFKAVRSLQDTLVIFPQALVLRAIHVERVSEEQLNTPIPCDTALAVRESLVRNLALMNVERLATFHPGLLEDLIIKANPKKNKRREAISVFIQAGCGNQSRSVSKFYRGMTLTLARLQIIKSVLKRSRISDPS